MEMWFWRRMERVSWTEKKTNEKVLKIVEEDRKLVNTIITRKRKWIGHILRGEGLMKDDLEGRMEGRMPRGSKRIGMLEELKEGSIMIMKKRADNGEDWKYWVSKT